MIEKLDLALGATVFLFASVELFDQVAMDSGHYLTFAFWANTGLFFPHNVNHPA